MVTVKWKGGFPKVTGTLIMRIIEFWVSPFLGNYQMKLGKDMEIGNRWKACGFRFGAEGLNGGSKALGSGFRADG